MPIIMGIDIIQEMFSEMGLGSPDLRDKLVKDLSIDVVDVSTSEIIDGTISLTK